MWNADYSTPAFYHRSAAFASRIRSGFHQGNPTMTLCTTCGRRIRARRITTPAAQLTFTWPAPRPVPLQRAVAPIRLMFLHGCFNADNDPRPALLPAGTRTPIMFENLPAALAAKRSMEAR